VSRSAGAAPGCLSVTPGRPALARCCAFPRRRGAGSPARSSVRERLTWPGPLCPGCPPARPVVFLAVWERPVAGCRRGGVLVSVCAGVGAVCESVVAAQRALGPGEGPEGSGEPGKPGCGGFPGFPGACTFREPKSRRGMRVLPRGARRPVHFPRSPVLVLPCTFPGSSCGGQPVLLCSFLGHWCGGFPGVRFRIGPPWCLFTRGVEMEVPDLGHSPSRGGGEVGKTEAARSEHVSAGSRGDRAGTAAHSARTRGRGAIRPLCGLCIDLIRFDAPRLPSSTAAK
jgi:hypothetical protein